MAEMSANTELFPETVLGDATAVHGNWSPVCPSPYSNRTDVVDPLPFAEPFRRTLLEVICVAEVMLALGCPNASAVVQHGPASRSTNSILRSRMRQAAFVALDWLGPEQCESGDIWIWVRI